MGYEFYNLLGYVCIIGATIITAIAQFFVSSNYQTYRNKKASNGMTGQEVARKILDKHGLNTIYVTEVAGKLTDHYDPNRKVVRLSHDVFHGDSIAAIAVASHECGHAVQHQEGYIMIKVRGAIFPFVNFASKFGYFAIVIGFMFNMLDLAWGGVGLLLVILLFQLITLPVEFDASKRALRELETENLVSSSELVGSKKMLSAAAFTYIASLAATILEILRFVLLIMGRRDRD